MYPIILIIASLAFGAPSALSETVLDEVSKNPDTLEAYVEEYFAETPVLANIAWCESRMRHFDERGGLLRGAVDSDDIGVMQINTRFHGEKAKELRLNLHALRGNLEYARYLYDTQGTRPWFKSAPCWGTMAVK